MSIIYKQFKTFLTSRKFFENIPFGQFLALNFWFWTRIKLKNLCWIILIYQTNSTFSRLKVDLELIHSIENVARFIIKIFLNKFRELSFSSLKKLFLTVVNYQLYYSLFGNRNGVVGSCLQMQVSVKEFLIYFDNRCTFHLEISIHIKAY